MEAMSLAQGKQGPSTMAEGVKNWVLDVLRESDKEVRKTSLKDLLQDGDRLVRLANHFVLAEDASKRVNPSQSEMSLVRSFENVNSFLKIGKEYFGLPDTAFFSYHDLKQKSDSKNMAQVTKCLLSLHNAVLKRDGAQNKDLRPELSHANTPRKEINAEKFQHLNDFLLAGFQTPMRPKAVAVDDVEVLIQGDETTPGTSSFTLPRSHSPFLLLFRRVYTRTHTCTHTHSRTRAPQCRT